MNGSRWKALALRRVAVLAAAVLPLAAAGLAMAGATAAQAAAASTTRPAGAQSPSTTCTVAEVELNDTSASISYGSETLETFRVTFIPSQPTCPTPTGDVDIDTNLGTGPTTLCTIKPLPTFLWRTISETSCTLKATDLAVGSDTVYGEYLGNATYTATQSNNLSITVTPGTVGTATTVNESAPGSAVYGDEQSENLLVTVTPTATTTPVPSGTVTVTSTSGYPVCTVTLGSSGSGTCVLPATALDAGTWDLVGVYGGDSNFASSKAGGEPRLTVTQATSTLQVTESPLTGLVSYGHENAIRYTATVTPEYAGSIPTGTVAVTSNEGTLCTINLPLSGGSGSCSPSASLLPDGGYIVQPSYSGDTNFTGSVATTMTFGVYPGTVTKVSLSRSSVAYGSEASETLSATVTANPSGSATPTGSVAFKVSGTTLCTVTLSSTGTAACKLSATQLPPGIYGAYASYGGVTNTIGASLSGAKTLTVAKDTSATTLKLSAAKATSGHENADHLSVVVKSAYPGAVTGKVTLSAKPAKGKQVKVCVLTLASGKGTCTLAAKALKPGTWKLAAAYAGNTDIAKSDSAKKTITIEK